MEKTISNFKFYWNQNYSYIEMVLSDREIENFLDMSPSIEMACDRASDYILSQGLGEVQE